MSIKDVRDIEELKLRVEALERKVEEHLTASHKKKERNAKAKQ